MANTDYFDLSESNQPFDGLVPSFGKNMGEKYMTGKRNGATDYLEVIDCEAVKDYIEKEVETPKYEGITVTFEGFISEKALNDIPQPENTVTVTIEHEYVPSETITLKSNKTYREQNYDGYFSQDTYDSTKGEFRDDFLVDNNYPEDGQTIYDYCNDVVEPTVGPIIPIAYIYTLILGAMSETPYSSVLLQSHAFERLSSDGIAIYPNVLLKFAIQDVYNFFDSIDEYGVAHINNMYNNPCYTKESLLNPKIYNWLVDFLQWHNLKIEDMENLETERDMKEVNVSTMKLAFNADLQSYDEVGNLMFDFNYNNMHFYDDINDCLIDFSEYSDEIRYMYVSVDKEVRVRAIFILETDDNIFSGKEGGLFPKLTIGFISDEYTIFTFLQNKKMNKINIYETINT